MSGLTPNSNRGPRVRVAPYIYYAMFVFSLPSALLSYLYLIAKNPLELGGWLVGLFGLFSVILQWLIYRDFEKSEEGDTGSPIDDYPVWLGETLEIWLRVFILLSLLSREIANVFYPLFDPDHGLCSAATLGWPVIGIYCKHGGECLAAGIGGFLKPADRDQRLFILGSLFAFFLIAIWNCFALYFRVRNCQQLRAVEHLAHETVVTLRIVLFIFVASISTGYWGLVLTNSNQVRDFATFLALTYMFLTAWVLGLRLNWPRTRLEGAVLHFLNKARQIGDPEFVGVRGKNVGRELQTLTVERRGDAESPASAQRSQEDNGTPTT